MGWIEIHEARFGLHSNVAIGKYQQAFGQSIQIAKADIKRKRARTIEYEM
jgi:hypothetical protein